MLAHQAVWSSAPDTATMQDQGATRSPCRADLARPLSAISCRAGSLADAATDDHLDKETLKAVERHHVNVRYLVPTGVRSILVGFGIQGSRVTELGWWESSTLGLSDFASDDGQRLRKTAGGSAVELDESSGKSEHSVCSPGSPYSAVLSVSDTATLYEESSLTVTCCPAQHNSGRNLLKRNSTLWASWYLTYQLAGGETCRIYFAG